MSVAALLTRLDALEARLDAGRRRAEAPGQIALDLTGATLGPPRQASGDGEKCGSGWIDPRKTCRKGTAGQAAAASEPPPSEARRSRPQERVAFEQPITGPTGAKLTAYTWKWTHDLVPDKDGDLVEKRVSNWEESLQNVETGRQVVHQFEVEVGGETRVVSAESALKVLGFVDPGDKKRFGSLKSTARTVARLRMALQLNDDRQKRFETDWEKVSQLPQPQVKVSDWRPHQAGGDGAEQRTWQMGEASEQQLRFPGRGTPFTDEEMTGNVRGQWLNQQMQGLGWGEGKRWWRASNERSSLARERDDLQTRIERAERKLQTTTRADNPSSRLDAFQERLDALKRKCSTGYGCGSTCISVKKECRSNPAAATSRERLQRLQQLSRGEIKPRGIGVPKAEEARAMATELQGQRQEKQAVIKAGRKRRQAETKASGRKPSVKVELQRAKPGGEYGPDGHWYPGGAWMSQGAYVGAKAEPIGEGQQGGQGEGEKSGPLEPRVVRPKRKPRRMRPLEPRGEGLPRPTGLKKAAAKNDEEWFNDRGYLIYPRPEGSQYKSLGGTHFEAAVIQRMTTDELRWATSQILRIAKRSPEDHAEMLMRIKDTDGDIERMGGLEPWGENARSWARNQLSGIDNKRLRAGQIFLTLAPFLGTTSPAAARLREAFRNPSEADMERFEWDRSAYAESLPDFPGEQGGYVWALNNAFRAVARRRQGAAGSRRDALNIFQARLDALKRKCQTGYGCGSTCISVKKECRSEGGASTSKERLRRLEQLARGEIKPRGLGVPKVEEARALVQQIQGRRGQKAQELKAQRAEASGGLIPTDQPFSPEMEARLKKGIVERTMRSGVVNYGGEELAEALLKVAQSPGGENARQALAFMEEAGILVNVAAESKEEIERITGKPSDELPWTRPLELAKFVREAGLVSDERLEWLRKDQTEAGRQVLRRAEIVRNPPKPSAEERVYKANYERAKADYKKAEEDFDRGVSQGWRFPEDKKSTLWLEKNSLDNDRKKYLAHRDGRLNEIKWAAQDLISGEMSGFAGRENGGYYQFGQKKYVVVSGDTSKSFAGVYKMDAADTDLANMRKHYSSHIERHLPERLAGLADTYDNFDLLHDPIGFSGKQTYAEKALSIHIHELGHVVDNFADVAVREIPETVASNGQRVLSHMKYSWSARHDNRPDAIKEALKEKRGPSNYALTNDDELFAESFASWVIAPQALRKHHPDLYAWVEDRFSRARTTMARNADLKFVEER